MCWKSIEWWKIAPSNIVVLSGNTFDVSAICPSALGRCGRWRLWSDPTSTRRLFTVASGNGRYDSLWETTQGDPVQIELPCSSSWTPDEPWEQAGGFKFWRQRGEGMETGWIPQSIDCWGSLAFRVWVTQTRLTNTDIKAVNFLHMFPIFPSAVYNSITLVYFLLPSMYKSIDFHLRWFSARIIRG